MALVTLVFCAHQPVRLLSYERRACEENLPPERIASAYFDEALNRDIFRRVAERCYLPATRLILELVRQQGATETPFRVAYGLSGTFLEQAERYAPELIALFQELARTGCVEFVGENYYHSLSSLYGASRAEFIEQVTLHCDALERLFGQRPAIFRSTECLYNNSIAETILSLNFEGVITEGVDWLLEGWRSPDFVYQAPNGLPVLLRNARLSEDIGYRFARRDWERWPLRAETFADWLAGGDDRNVTLVLDYETFGEHIPAEEGIFDFLRGLPEAVGQHPQAAFATPSEVVRRQPRVGTILVNDFATISWTDAEKDTSAWLGNAMQQFAFEKMKRMEMTVKAANDPELLRAWRLMQASDHLYYLSDKSLGDGGARRHFNAYGSIFEGFVRLHTALADLLRRADRLTQAAPPPEAEPQYPPKESVRGPVSR